MGGVVVRAEKGFRDRYLPLSSALTASRSPLDVAKKLLSRGPFSTLYIADLDAIQLRGDNTLEIARVREALPHIDIWIDNGCADENALRATFEIGTPVLGSESGPSMDLLAAHNEVVLSLDFDQQGFRGPHPLLARSEIWPNRLIVMTLDRIGTGGGPDLSRFSEIAARAGERELYAAGGVRNLADLDTLHRLGAMGALVASAIHSGEIGG